MLYATTPVEQNGSISLSDYWHSLASSKLPMQAEQQRIIRIRVNRGQSGSESESGGTEERENGIWDDTDVAER